MMAQWYEDPQFGTMKQSFQLLSRTALRKFCTFSPNWVNESVGSRVQFIKMQPLISCVCVQPTPSVFLIFPVKTLTEFGVLEQKEEAKENIARFVGL